MKLKQKPIGLVCYLCGRQFGTSSLEIHLKSCKQKFHIQQNKKQPRQRIKIPQEPSLLSQILSGNHKNLSQYNDEATKIHKYQVMPKCANCGKTFNQDSYKIHIKSCQKKGGFGQSKQNESNFRQTQYKKPRTLACCICGRQFGLNSLKIHYPQCLQKYKNQQKIKPKQQRRKIPTFSQQKIQMINNKQDWTVEQIQIFNNQALGIYKQKAMVHCANCKRSFVTQAYKKHLKNCQLINGKNTNTSPNNDISKYSQPLQIKKPKVLACHICGRQFGITSLSIHQKTCATKFENNQNLKPKNQRRPVPSMPNQIWQRFDLATVQSWPVQKIQQYNTIANQVYRSDSMIQCKFCHRKFIQTSFSKHFNYCQKQAEKNIENENLNNKKTIQNNKNIQQITFKKKPEKMILERKPQQKQFQQQKQIKQVAQILQETTKQNQQLIDQKAKQQKQISLSNQKIQLPIKQQVIQTKKQSQKQIEKLQKFDLQQKQNQDFQQNSSRSLVPCKKCGRKFLDNRVGKHQQTCKAKPLPKKQIQDSKVEDKQKRQNLFQIKKSTCSPTKKNILPKQPQNKQRYEEIHQKQKVKDQQENIQFKQCSKCERKFASDRLQYHENVCKGKKLTNKLDLKYNKNDIMQEKIQKTKTNFYNMVKELKGKKIKQEQIDHQLNIQMNQFLISPQNKFKKQTNKLKQNEQINLKNNLRSIQLKPITQTPIKSTKIQRGKLPHI